MVLFLVLASSERWWAQTRLVLILVLIVAHRLFHFGVHLSVCVAHVGLRCWVVYVLGVSGVAVGVLSVLLFLPLLLLLPALRICIWLKSLHPVCCSKQSVEFVTDRDVVFVASPDCWNMLAVSRHTVRTATGLSVQCG